MRLPQWSAARIAAFSVALLTIAAQCHALELTTDPGSRLSPEQRQQLLLLRGIVWKALKGINATSSGAGGAVSTIDYDDDAAFLDGKRAWNETHRVVFIPPWWESRPVIIGGIAVGFLLLTALIFAAFFCSPLYPRMCPKKRCREDQDDMKEALSYDEDHESDGQKSKELPINNLSPFGTIRYLMVYQLSSEQLIITVKNCTDLPRNSITGSLDPYVTIRIMYKQAAVAAAAANSAESPKLDELPVSSPVAQNSVSPQFNFTGSFRVAPQSLPKVAALFEVFDCGGSAADKSGAMVARHVHAIHDPVEGHELGDIMTVDGCEFEGQLKRGHRAPGAGPGDICVLLKRSRAQETLMVRIIECKGVYLRDSEGRPDMATMPNTYVEATLTEPHGRIHTRRTETVRRSRNPYYNEEFSFAVSTERLRQCSLRLCLIHISDILRFKQTVGVVELSAEGGGADSRLAREHWMAVTQVSEVGVGASRESRDGAAPDSSWVAKCSWHRMATPEEEAKQRVERAVSERGRLHRLRRDMSAPASLPADGEEGRD